MYVVSGRPPAGQHCVGAKQTDAVSRPWNAPDVRPHMTRHSWRGHWLRAARAVADGGRGADDVDADTIARQLSQRLPDQRGLRRPGRHYVVCSGALLFLRHRGGDGAERLLLFDAGHR